MSLPLCTPFSGHYTSHHFLCVPLFLVTVPPIISYVFSSLSVSVIGSFCFWSSGPPSDISLLQPFSLCLGGLGFPLCLSPLLSPLQP